MKSDISALIDGEQAANETDPLFDALRRDDRLRDHWNVYHLIGDALRNEGLSEDLTPRVMARLAEEPVLLASRRKSGVAMTRWALPLAASLMGVGVVAWLALSFDSPHALEQVATARVSQGLTVPVAGQPNSDHLQEYLLAHQAYSPSNTMQGIAPYVRSVSEIRPVAER